MFVSHRYLFNTPPLLYQKARCLITLSPRMQSKARSPDNTVRNSGYYTLRPLQFYWEVVSENAYNHENGRF